MQNPSNRPDRPSQYRSRSVSARLPSYQDRRRPSFTQTFTPSSFNHSTSQASTWAFQQLHTSLPPPDRHARRATLASITPPEFHDLRRYSLGSVDFSPTPPQPSISSSYSLLPPAQPRSASNRPALPHRRHSSPYFIPERQTRSCSTSSTSSLRPSNISNSPERRFGCKFCSYTSDRRFDRDRHARSHTGERPYVCSGAPFCSETFARGDAKRFVF